MIDFPCAFNSLMIANSSSASCGVRTARRLVEHEDLRAAVERLEDLDALLLGDGDVLDARVGIDREAEAVGELAHAAPGLADVEQHPGVRRLLGEDDVLGHRHHGDRA